MEIRKSYFPLCSQSNEDWYHVLQCTVPSPTTHRELYLFDFKLKLIRHKTYPPLADFLYEMVETFAQNPEELAIMNAKYNLIFHQAYQQQSNIGWEIFPVDLSPNIGKLSSTNTMYRLKEGISTLSTSGPG